MIELKCKMCGATLEKKDRSNYAICEYCGSKVILENVNDEKFKNLLINAHRAVDDKDLKNIQKYYSLLQEEFPEDNIIETTFYITVTKVKFNNNMENIQEIINEHRKLFDSLEVIEKYYNVTENREQVFERMSNFLFKMAFPMGKIYYSSNKYMCDLQFYNLICEFNNKLERLLRTYNDECIRKLISKHKQIIRLYNNERNKAFKSIYIIFLIMAIIGTVMCFGLVSSGYVEDVPFPIAVILPWFCVIVTKIIWNKK